MAVESPIGSVLAGFRVDRLLGHGAMGDVYLAKDAAAQPVALKLLAPELARDERFRRRFLREAALAATLEHPHIVRTLASGEEGGVLYMALAYVDGFDLRELLRREGRLDPKRALRLVRQAGDALDAAHDSGLVHRDVKPGNILVAPAPDGEHAYVCDFGLARHVSSVGSLTGDRGFVGTVDYVAPEQIRGASVDGRADVYSLACVLYECLTGERPFDRDSELAVVFAHLNEPPPSVSEARRELPDALDDVVRTALAKSPGDRYATCGQLVHAAQAALSGKAHRTSKRRRYLAAGAAVTVAAAATIGAVIGNPRGSGDAAPQPQITQSSIAGARLGHRERYYTQRLGDSRRLVLVGPGLSALAFNERRVAVYFTGETGPARIVTTWNPAYRTAEGIGPCSTLADLRRAYGDELKRVSWAGTSPAGTGERSWTAGTNLLFSTHDHVTVAAVALFRGDPNWTGRNSWRAWANYVAADETPCS